MALVAQGRSRVGTNVAMAAEVLEQLNLAQSALGEDLLAEDIGDFFDGYALASLGIGSSAGDVSKKRNAELRHTYQTIPYAP